MIRKSEQHQKIDAALQKARGGMKSAIRDSDNPFFKSKYADLASVAEACEEALRLNGLAFSAWPSHENGSLTLDYTLIHESGEWMENSVPMNPVKPDPQGVGSCITYYRRYCKCAVLDVVVDDDDGNAASGKTDGREERRPKREKTSTTIGPDQPPVPPMDVKYITEKQRSRLYAIVKGHSWIDEDVKDLLKEFGISSSKHVPAGVTYDKICAIVEKHGSYGEYLDYATNNPTQRWAIGEEADT